MQVERGRETGLAATDDGDLGVKVHGFDDP